MFSTLVNRFSTSRAKIAVFLNTPRVCGLLLRVRYSVRTDNSRSAWGIILHSTINLETTSRICSRVGQELVAIDTRRGFEKFQRDVQWIGRRSDKQDVEVFSRGVSEDESGGGISAFDSSIRLRNL